MKMAISKEVAVLPKQERRSGSRAWLCPLAIIAIVGFVYSNSHLGPFIFDDLEIATNTSIRQLWPPWKSMFAPPNVSRPLTTLSYAINYSISGLDPASYHALNLIIHVLAALTLFGVVRRTLQTDRLRHRFGRSAEPLAFSVAVVWAVHPLQTESVTYIAQRCGLLLGLFYVLTLYCVMRSFTSQRKVFWSLAAVGACLAGMLSDQVMATAPLVVLAYDVFFEAGSFKQALTRRWALYVGLAATWLALAATVLAAPASLTAGLDGSTISPWDYFKSELGVIAYYLRLSIWPRPLVLDYGWPKAESLSRIIPPMVFVGALLGATVWAASRRRAAGFLGVWFFLIIGSTSSFIPFSDLAFEHRMYLPLAAVVSLIVLGTYWLGFRLVSAAVLNEQARKRTGQYAAGVVVALVIAVFGLMTLGRNVYYQNPVGMWKDVVEKRPDNARGHNNFGILSIQLGRREEAIRQFQEACRLNPFYAKARCNLGSALTEIGKFEEGEAQLIEAVGLKRNYAEAYYWLGRNLVAQGKLDEAVNNFSLAVQANPDLADAYFYRGLARKRQGKVAEAITDFNASLEKRPDSAEVLSHLAVTLAAQDDPSLRNPGEGVRLAERAVALTNRQEPVPLDALGVAYAEQGRFAEAIDAANLAVDLAQRRRNSDLVSMIETRIQLYQARRGWRSKPVAPAAEPSSAGR